MSDTFAIARARHALEEAGLDVDLPLQRASSVTNEVWVSDHLVVRVNRHPNQRLRREAALGPLLPAEIGYPRIVAYGGRLGADWLVVERVRGIVLSRAWPAMTTDERRRAVAQVAVKLRALHGVRPPDDLPPIDTPQLLGGSGFRAVDPLLGALDRLAALPHVDRGVVDEARQLVLNTCAAIEPYDSPTLVHGDLHFENVLWDGEQVTTLLDLEYCRTAPPDVDLDVFLRFCAFPFLFVADDYASSTLAADYADVSSWMAEDYPELFESPNLFERLLLYALAFEVRNVLDLPPSAPWRELGMHHPYRRFDRLVTGRSYLHRWAGRMAYDPLDLTAPLDYRAGSGPFD